MNELISTGIIAAAVKSISIYTNRGKRPKTLPGYVLELIRFRKIARKRSKKEVDINIYKTQYNKLTHLIREEISAFKNNELTEFVQKLGKNPTSAKPF